MTRQKFPLCLTDLFLCSCLPPSWTGQNTDKLKIHPAILVEPFLSIFHWERQTKLSSILHDMSTMCSSDITIHDKEFAQISVHLHSPVKKETLRIVRGARRQNGCHAAKLIRSLPTNRSVEYVIINIVFVDTCRYNNWLSWLLHRLLPPDTLKP